MQQVSTKLMDVLIVEIILEVRNDTGCMYNNFLIVRKVPRGKGVQFCLFLPCSGDWYSR